MFETTFERSYYTRTSQIAESGSNTEILASYTLRKTLIFSFHSAKKRPFKMVTQSGSKSDILASCALRRTNNFAIC